MQVYQYVTEGTFDAYLYQTLEHKQKFISQIMTSKSPVRSCDDVDEQALSYAEILSLIHILLFLLGEGGLLFIQNPLLLAVCILHGIVNTNIPQIQRIRCV